MTQLKDAVSDLEAALRRLENSVESLTDRHAPGRIMQAEA